VAPEVAAHRHEARLVNRPSVRRRVLDP
jgi:hypothetical protein